MANNLTYSVEICDRATGGEETYEMTIETARSHVEAARKAIRPLVGSVITLDSEPALGGDRSTRSTDRFYGTRDYTITVWKHAPSN